MVCASAFCDRCSLGAEAISGVSRPQDEPKKSNIGSASGLPQFLSALPLCNLRLTTFK